MMNFFFNSHITQYNKKSDLAEEQQVVFLKDWIKQNTQKIFNMQAVILWGIHFNIIAALNKGLPMFLKHFS
jgi:hypothetical protein